MNVSFWVQNNGILAAIENRDSNNDTMSRK